jgi:hypothetical protein
MSHIVAVPKHSVKIDQGHAVAVMHQKLNATSQNLNVVDAKLKD